MSEDDMAIVMQAYETYKRMERRKCFDTERLYLIQNKAESQEAKDEIDRYITDLLVAESCEDDAIGD